MPALQQRYQCYDQNGGLSNNCSGNDGWGNWGRWILLAAIIIGTFFIFFIFACISARRRRQQGFQPYRGTGWLPGTTPPGHGPAQYTGAAPQYNNQQYGAPPVYSPTPNQTYYGPESNQPYFRGQEQGVELQQPQSTYQPAIGGDPVYTAPAGPPPGKKGDRVIR